MNVDFKDGWPMFVNARVLGIREHLERARALYGLGTAQTSPQARYRLMLAAIYSCRAITEIMLEAAAKQQVSDPGKPGAKLERNALELWFKPRLPYYSLIERIRIHDFHRFGIVPPHPTIQTIVFQGPLKFKASRGVAGVVGPFAVTSGNSSVEQQRPLYIDDGKFFDDESSELVEIGSVVNAFLSAAGALIHEFEKLIVEQCGPC